MTTQRELIMEGLPGNNPLGFMAALGVQVALSEQGYDCALHWTDQAMSHPVLTPAFELEEIAACVASVATSWLSGSALSKSVNTKLALSAPQMREYLEQARSEGSVAVLASCLIAENSLDNSKKAKPTDLFFTAGQQKFLGIVRSVLEVEDATEYKTAVVTDLSQPWRYVGTGDSLMWDVVDDRDHALSSTDPSKENKPNNPGAEALAVLGLSRYPCFASSNGTLTRGCAGSWKRGQFVWPLWGSPARYFTVGSLLDHVSPSIVKHASKRLPFYKGWSIRKVYQSQIRRSDQGGYGTFGPAQVIWQRD